MYIQLFGATGAPRNVLWLFCSAAAPSFSAGCNFFILQIGNTKIESCTVRSTPRRRTAAGTRVLQLALTNCRQAKADTVIETHHRSSLLQFDIQRCHRTGQHYNRVHATRVSITPTRLLTCISDKVLTWCPGQRRAGGNPSLDESSLGTKKRGKRSCPGQTGGNPRPGACTSTLHAVINPEALIKRRADTSALTNGARAAAGVRQAAVHD